MFPSWPAGPGPYKASPPARPSYPAFFGPDVPLPGGDPRNLKPRESPPFTGRNFGPNPNQGPTRECPLGVFPPFFATCHCTSLQQGTRLKTASRGRQPWQGLSKRSRIRRPAADPWEMEGTARSHPRTSGNRPGCSDNTTLPGVDYLAFRHLTFQEYGAARALVEACGDDPAALWAVLEPHLLEEEWAEVIPLTLAHLEDATRWWSGCWRPTPEMKTVSVRSSARRRRYGWGQRCRGREATGDRRPGSSVPHRDWREWWIASATRPSRVRANGGEDYPPRCSSPWRRTGPMDAGSAWAPEALTGRPC